MCVYISLFYNNLKAIYLSIYLSAKLCLTGNPGFGTMRVFYERLEGRVVKFLFRRSASECMPCRSAALDAERPDNVPTQSVGTSKALVFKKIKKHNSPARLEGEDKKGEAS
jgi:hypothetical protein